MSVLLPDREPAADALSIRLPPAAQVSVTELRAILADGGESALIDVREVGVHCAAGHILLSVPLPLSHLELRVAGLIPRRASRVIVYDGGSDGLAARAADKLIELGYTAVSVLTGGLAAWRADGGEVFTGFNALSKTFGEFVEHAYDTPRIAARDLKARLDAGDDVVVLDSRPLSEFAEFSIPGGTDCPGAELVYRVHDLVPSPQTLVVVNCAGRTRSIIGAQALINAGLPNRVVSLENGTMAWLQAGFALAQGEARLAPPPTPEGLARATAAAEQLSRRFGIRRIDAATLAGFRTEADQRTLYLLDVRGQAEYEAGHLRGSRWAPGGQLVQALDQWVATRQARVVLVDAADGVRAAITASWLIQIGGFEIFVYLEGLAGPGLETGPDRWPRAAALPEVATVTPSELGHLLEAGRALVVDFDTSLAFEAGHIPGAWFAIRSRLAERLPQLPALPGNGLLVLTSADGDLAALAAPEAAALAGHPVRVLAGGTAAWRAAGRPLVAGDTGLPETPDDVSVHSPGLITRQPGRGCG